MLLRCDLPIPESGQNSRGGRALPELEFVNHMLVGQCVEFKLSDPNWKTRSDTVRRKMRRLGFSVTQKKTAESLFVWRKA